MKKHICFAGFGDVELEALQPSLSALNGAWNCVFSPDAASALNALAGAPFDAAVANLTPGGIDDTELLEQAAIRHPRTMRFVLGDVADRELVVNRMGAAHQFISRPWKPRELVSIIERTLALDSWLSNDSLRAFIPRLGKLPGLPSTYFEVLKKAESPHSTIESISEIIAHDPALTARLLQMVNSPACGLKKKITSPSEAVSQLGLDTVKSLVLCLQLYAQSAPAKVGSLSLEQLWHHSFNVAKTAAKIVLHCISSEGMSSEAYTAGLLHNIGQIVVATNLSEEYAAVVQTARKRKCPLQDVEREQLGVTSSQVGAYLLGIWGMPLPIVEATALHLNPASASSIEFSLLTVVHIANVLASEDQGRKNSFPLPHLDADYLGTLDLPQKSDAWRKLLATAPAPANRAEVESHIAPHMAPPPPALSEKPARRSGKIIFAAVTIIALIVAVVFVKYKHNPASASVASVFSSTTAKDAPAPADGTATADATSAAPAPAPTASPLDSIQLKAILYNAGHGVALINGQTLEKGDRFDGMQVVSITPSAVVLSYKGEQRAYKWQSHN